MQKRDVLDAMKSTVLRSAQLRLVLRSVCASSYSLPHWPLFSNEGGIIVSLVKTVVALSGYTIMSIE